MSLKPNIPRQHHFLPRFYLDGFCDPAVLSREGKKVVWVYEKGKSPRRSNPQNEARERDFYTFDKDGTKDLRAEEWLGKVEQTVAPIIRRLHDARYELTAVEREWLAIFVGTMNTRTPAGRRLMEGHFGPTTSRLMKEAATDIDTFRSLCQGLKRPLDPEVDIEEVRRDILEGKGEIISERPDFKLASVIDVGLMEAEVLLELSWQIVHAEGTEYFLTSDDPVVAGVWEKEKQLARFHMGFNVVGVDIYFPMTRSLCLRMKRGIDPGPCRVPDRGIRYFNKTTLMCAHRRVYAAEHSPRLKRLFDKRGCQASVETVRLEWEGQPI
jgi:hypothetical protein